ncbi:MAG TPA: RDD family protein [Actinomycetota bacterium]|nr:RDD family protein [Actinomycetota bacterium]
MSMMTGTTTYAGFWRRVAAVIIDGLLLSVVTVPFTLAMGDGDTYAEAARSSGASSISAVVGWLYYALMESSAKQATVGKMALGIIVTDIEGRRIGFGKATGRHFAKILSALILGIGFLMVAFTQRKQGLHDILAGTLVVKGAAPSPAQAPSMGAPSMPPPPPAP